MLDAGTEGSDESGDLGSDTDGDGASDGGWSQRLFCLGWIAATMAPFALLVSRQQDHFARWSKDLPAPIWWAIDGSSWTFAPLGGLAVAGLVVAFRRRMDPFVKLGLLFSFLAGGVCWSAVAVQAYHAIAGLEFIVHPIEPWAPVLRLPLRQLTVEARGCEHTTGKHSSDTAIFRVRYGAGAWDVVNLGAGVGARGAADWLRAMAPFEATDLPAGTDVGVPRHRACFATLAARLAPGDQARLFRLLD